MILGKVYLGNIKTCFQWRQPIQIQLAAAVTLSDALSAADAGDNNPYDSYTKLFQLQFLGTLS